MIEPQASSFDKISPTALMVAYTRQFTDIPYSKELAQLVDARTIVEQLLDQKSEKPIEVAVLLEGRYKAINQVMAQFEATQRSAGATSGGAPVQAQVIELASGLLPRGMAMSQNPVVTFVESDLPAMIRRKQQLVKRLIGERPNLHLIAIDATSRPSQFPLHADYLHPGKPVIILCEGLLMYLTFAEKQQVFANVREMLRVYGGVWITPDLTTLDSLGRIRQNNPALYKLGQRIDSMTGRSVTDNYFESFDHAKQFVSEQGFWIEEYSMLDVVDQLTCLSPLSIDLDVAKSLLAASSVFALSVKDGLS